MAQLNIRDLNRVRQILGVLGRHGFGGMLIQAGLGRYMPENGAQGSEQEHWAVRIRRALAELGPTFVKLGQILSVRPDIIPARLAEEFAQLQDRVPPVEFEAIKRVVEADLHAELEESFASFEPECMASASIAQVHRAELPNGTPVAVKVRRPDIVPVIRADLRILYTLAHLVEGQFELPGVYTPVAIVGEFEAAVLQELDFFQEAHNCERFRTSMESAHPDILVPRVHSSHSARRVLSLELCEGTALNALPDDDPRCPVVAHKLLEASYTQVFENGLFHGDPHPGNLLVLEDGGLGYLDFGLVGTITVEMRQVVSAIFMALVFRDADALVMAFTRASASSRRVDLKALKTELEVLMARFHGASLTTLTEQANLMEFIEVIARHRLIMPREYAVLARTSNLVFGITRKLLPNADIVEEVRPLAERLMTRQLAPDKLATEAARMLFLARTSLSQLPLQATQLMSDAEAGRLQVNTHNRDAQAFLEELRRAGVGIARALCTLALTVAGAIMLVPLDLRPAGVPVVPLVGIVTLIVSSFMWAGLVAHTHLARRLHPREIRKRLGRVFRFLAGGRNSQD